MRHFMSSTYDKHLNAGTLRLSGRAGRFSKHAYAEAVINNTSSIIAMTSK